MKVEFIKNHGRFKKGEQCELVNGLAHKYINLKVAKEIQFIEVEEILRRQAEAANIAAHTEKEVKKSKIKENG